MTGESSDVKTYGGQFQERLRLASWDSALARNALWDADAKATQAEAARVKASEFVNEQDAERESVMGDVLYDLFNASSSGAVNAEQAFEVARQIALEIGDQDFGVKVAGHMAFAKTLTPDKYLVLHGRVHSIAGPAEDKAGVFPVFKLEQGEHGGAHLETSFALPFKDRDGGVHGYIAPTGDNAPVIGDKAVIMDYLGGELDRAEKGPTSRDFSKKRKIGENFTFIGQDELAQHCYAEANSLAAEVVVQLVERYDSKSRDNVLEAMQFLLEHAPDILGKQFDEHAVAFVDKHGFPSTAFGTRSDLRFAELYAYVTAAGPETDEQLDDLKMEVLNRLYERGKQLKRTESDEVTQS